MGAQAVSISPAWDHMQPASLNYAVIAGQLEPSSGS